MKDTKAYNLGYEVGQWIAHNEVLAIILGILFLVLFVYGFTKVMKQMRNFGEY